VTTRHAFPMFRVVQNFIHLAGRTGGFTHSQTTLASLRSGNQRCLLIPDA
jgi:hypothetical protein